MFTSKKHLDKKEDHDSKHTIEDQSCSWATPMKNCLSAVKKKINNWVLTRHPIFWDIRHFEKSKRMKR
jgi:hypothetical protein